MQTLRWLCLTLILLTSVGVVAQTPSPMTWDQVRHRFEQNNPTLLADQLNIDESKAQEITAVSPAQSAVHPIHRRNSDRSSQRSVAAVSGTLFVSTVSYLHEREHKRELRLESAAEGQRPSRSPPRPTWSGRCCSACAAPSYRPCRPRPFCSWPKTTWPITTMCSTSAAPASRPATSRRSISTAWSCSACSMSPTSKPPTSTCAPPRSRCSRCSTTARRSTSTTSPAPMISPSCPCRRTSSARLPWRTVPTCAPPWKPSTRRRPTTSWRCPTVPPIPTFGALGHALQRLVQQPQ